MTVVIIARFVSTLLQELPYSSCDLAQHAPGKHAAFNLCLCPHTRMPMARPTCRNLPCEHLAGTNQEDADALAMWYSGWYNGLAKKHLFNPQRAKEGLHQVIVYCKANPDKKVIQAIAVVLKVE